jgi:hypothetical protein
MQQSEQSLLRELQALLQDKDISDRAKIEALAELLLYLRQLE